MDQPNVLIVDDDEPTVDAYAGCLAGAGLACRSALNGWDALELISGGFHPKVVVSDLRMPELDGIGFAQQLGQYMTGRPALIFISGNAGLEDAVQAIRLGANDFLAKPIDCDALVRAVKSPRRISATCCAVRAWNANAWRDKINELGPVACLIDSPHATAVSTVSHGRHTCMLGMIRKLATCSTGWCVGPSSPNPIESWVKT